MRQLNQEQAILERAVAALEATTGLRIELQVEPRGQAGARPDGLLDIFIEQRPIRFVAEVKAVDRFQTLGVVKAKEQLTQHPTLLVAPYITEATAARCRELHLPFIDEAGNAYIDAQGLFVYVTGKRRPTHVRLTPDFRALTPAGLRIVFTLLNNPDMVNAPYREIAKAARVALGTVGEVLTDLEHRGHLAPEKPGPRRLLEPEKLRDEWVTHYPIKLRPKLNARRYTGPKHDWWREKEIRQHNACWGGEVAAEKLTGYLKAARVTLYVDGKPDALILANRLRPDVNGEVEILEAFWTIGEGGQIPDIAPHLIVYADLMATTDPRNIETAKMIHDKYLTNAHDAA
jgi:hypothetical protein